MPNPSFNAKRAHADADQIVHRLLHRDDTLRSLAREYRVVIDTIERIYRNRTTRRQRELARARKISRTKRGKTPFVRVWNKGIRTGIRPANAFPAGHVVVGPRAAKSLGTVTVRAHRGVRARWIKVRKDGRHRDRWMPFARWLWETTHGRVPSGKRVIHRDGDTMNDAITNLILGTGGDTLFIAIERNPRLAQRQRLNAAKARRGRAELQHAISAMRRKGRAA